MNETQIKQLAKNPKDLIQVINNISNIKELSTAIEVLGEEVKDEALILPILKRFLKHVHLKIRESALLAVSTFYDNKKLNPDILSRVMTISKSDPSSDIRDYATDILREFDAAGQKHTASG